MNNRAIRQKANIIFQGFETAVLDDNLNDQSDECETAETDSGLSAVSGNPDQKTQMC